MNYKQYLASKYKGLLLFGLGFGLLLGSLYFSHISFYVWKLNQDLSSMIIWGMAILGIIFLIIGHFIFNRHQYEREESGQRLYHYKGKFR